MAKLCAVLFMCVLLGAVVCAPLPENESSPSLGEVQAVLPILERVLHRSPRQVNPNREQVINNIFQIPIATLSAVSSLLQSTRPLFSNLPNNPAQTPVAAPTLAPALAPSFAGHGTFHHRRQTIGARVAQVSPAADGSSFKI